MAASQEQKVDFLLKKIGYVASKTGIAEDESSLTGTKKAPFGEAIPSPLVVPATNIWSDSSLIPATPPGSTGATVQVYLAGTSGHRMTADSTISGNRTFIAYSTYNNSSTAILGDWIDTSFGADYIVKVYKGDPNSGGVQLSAAGSGSNDTWFFDYSSGVLNFNGTSVPSGVTSSNIYIVGYRYVGGKGAQPTSGFSTFTSLNVTGITTLATAQVTDLTNDRVVIAGTGGELEDSANLTFDGTLLTVAGVATVGNVKIDANEIHTTSGNLTIDSAGGNVIVDDDLKVVGLLTAANAYIVGNLTVEGTTTTLNTNLTEVDKLEVGANNTTVGAAITQSGTGDILNLYDGNTEVFSVQDGGRIVATATNNVIPFLYSTYADLPSAGTYHGAFAHVHATGSAYYAHAGAWWELVRRESTGVVGTGTETYNIAKVKGFNYLAAPYGGTETITVTVADKVSGEHRYHGQGSAKGYVFDGLQSPFITLTPGRTYRFDQSDSSNNTHQIKFYLEADKTTLYEGGVTYNGTAGSSGAYTQIVVGDETPTVLHYMCVNHGYMGNAAQVNSNVVNTNYEATLRGNLSVSGISTFTGLIDANGGANIASGLVANSAQISDLTDGRVVLAGSSGELEDSANLVFSGTNLTIGTATTVGLDIETRRLNVSGIATFASIDLNGGIDIDGVTDLDVVNIAETLNVTGIATFANNIDANGNLDVDGQTDLDVLNVAEDATFNSTVYFESTVSAASSTGAAGQVLQSTGVGVTWATTPATRTSQTFTAAEDQTTFSFNYSVGLLDVFYNGVKLASSEFTANNGTSVVLGDVAYAGDIIEFISYNTITAGSGGGGASNLNALSDVSISGTPVVGEILTHDGSGFVNDFTTSLTTTATTQVALLSLDLSVYRSVEYQIQVTEGSNYLTTKILAIHNGTAAVHNEYGTLSIGTAPATFDVDISGSNLRLLVTPASTNSTVTKVKFTGIKV